MIVVLPFSSLFCVRTTSGEWDERPINERREREREPRATNVCVCVWVEMCSLQRRQWLTCYTLFSYADDVLLLLAAVCVYLLCDIQQRIRALMSHDNSLMWLNAPSLSTQFSQVVGQNFGWHFKSCTRQLTWHFSFFSFCKNGDWLASESLAVFKPNASNACWFIVLCQMLKFGVCSSRLVVADPTNQALPSFMLWLLW